MGRENYCMLFLPGQCHYSSRGLFSVRIIVGNRRKKTSTGIPECLSGLSDHACSRTLHFALWVSYRHKSHAFRSCPFMHLTSSSISTVIYNSHLEFDGFFSKPTKINLKAASTVFCLCLWRPCYEASCLYGWLSLGFLQKFTSLIPLCSMTRPLLSRQFSDISALSVSIHFGSIFIQCGTNTASKALINGLFPWARWFRGCPTLCIHLTQHSPFLTAICTSEHGTEWEEGRNRAGACCMRIRNNLYAWKQDKKNAFSTALVDNKRNCCWQSSHALFGQPHSMGAGWPPPFILTPNMTWKMKRWVWYLTHHTAEETELLCMLALLSSSCIS